jgi:hypothetical protein
MRRWLRHSLLVLAAVVALPVTPASAAAGFTDPFTALDPLRWVAGEHGLGRSRLDRSTSPCPAVPSASALSAGTVDGAEVRTTSLQTGT